ncbi:hypothetical protein BRW83_1711 [Oxalobacter formigenes]|nr:hypothetical protein BRW83_1711 [Oxalobacter formigenes]QDX32871.1 hypothetical protein FPZ51_04350 [Oxalobacter formigenes]
MSRANYPETILNNPNGTAIYVIDRESHKILYFNDCVRDVVPGSDSRHPQTRQTRCKNHSHHFHVRKHLPG